MHPAIFPAIGFGILAGVVSHEVWQRRELRREKAWLEGEIRLVKNEPEPCPAAPKSNSTYQVWADWQKQADINAGGPRTRSSAAGLDVD